MTKNITILNAQGNMIGTTYPKRAKGLVKSGRAYFVDGSAIVLVCPPENSMQKYQEDTDMETIDDMISEVIGHEFEKNILEGIEHIVTEVKKGAEMYEENEKAKEKTAKTEETSETASFTASKESADSDDTIAQETSKEDISSKAMKFMEAGISLKDILYSLNKIHEDNGYIKKALDDLEKLPYTMPRENSAPDLAAQARAESIADIVKCRETTNQMMIKLYTQIYTDYMA